MKPNLRRTLVASLAVIVLWGLFAWSIHSTNQLSTKIKEKKSQESPSPELSPLPSPQTSPFEELIIKKDKIQIQVKYEGGQFIYQGLVKLPTPCDTLSTDALVLESYPQQIQIKINTQKSNQICAQVIKEKEFSGEVTAPQTSVVKIFFNNTPID